MKTKPIACSMEIKEVNGRIQLFPFGRFYPADNREAGQGGWYVDDTNGYFLADQINQMPIDLMIDYEHQTLYMEKNGQPNPASGWMKHAEYLSGEGIFVDVDWTEKARAQIKNKEYRYISPLFLAEEGTGRVMKVINAALVNRPALHNLAEAYAASQQVHQLKGNNPMLELLKKLFGAENATEAEIKQKLTALSAAKGNSPVSLSEVYAKLAEKETQVVALSAKVNTEPDPTKYVALSELTKVQTAYNQLQEQVNAEKVSALIEVALSEGRLLPAQKAWAENLGKTNLVALSDYLKTVTPNPALTAEKQAKSAPTNTTMVALSAEERAAAKMLGMSEAEFIQEHKEQK